MSSHPLIVLLLAIWAIPASAQEGAVDLDPVSAVALTRLHGSRVRITAPADSPDSANVLVGTLISSDAASLVIRRDGSTAPVTVARQSVSVEEWHRHDPTQGAMVLGAVLGAVAGGLVAHAVNGTPEPRSACRSDPGDFGGSLLCGFGNSLMSGVEASMDEALAVGSGIALGAVVGLLTGRAIGKSMASQGWIPAGERAQLAVTPSAAGAVQLGISIPH